MVNIRKCTIADLESAPNIHALLDEYAKESAIDGLPAPSAKVEIYKNMESTGSITVFGAYSHDLLVGFITVLSPVLPHYGRLIAVGESLFVAKEYRNTGAGWKLIHTAEEHAKALGSPGFLLSAPVGGVLIDILPHNGYKETNRVFFKRFT